MTPAEIFARFGRELVLLKLRAGEKAPIDQGWQRLTLADMTPEYLASLNGNIGVKLGPDAGNVASIDIDVDGEGQQFLMLNPRIADTVISNGARGCNVWLEVTGQMPSRTHKIKTRDGQPWGEWRWAGGQTVISGTHPSGVKYSVRGGPVLKIDFEDIVWPDYLELPWASKKCPYDEDLPKPLETIHALLRAERHAGLIRGVPPDTSVNITYAAQYFFVTHRIVFDVDYGRFYLYKAEFGAWEIISQPELGKSLHAWWSEVVFEFNQDMTLIHREGPRLIVDLSAELKNFAAEKGRWRKLERIIHAGNLMIHINDDLETVTPRAFSSKYFSRNRIPINFDPDAECPKFLAFLAAGLEPDDIDLLIRYFGACILTGNQAQRMMVLAGKSHTGKTQTIKLLTAFLGAINCAEMRPQFLHQRFEIGRYYGKILLTGIEMRSEFMESNGAQALKKLVGGDPLTGEVKCQMDNLDMVGDFNVIMGTNEDLHVTLHGDDDVQAWRNRLMILKYAKALTVKEVKDYWKVLFDEEGPGILNLAIEGAMAHLRELRDYGNFVLTDEQKARVDKLLEESESVRHFVERCLEVKRGSDGSTSAELTEAYLKWCQQMGWVPPTSRSVALALPDHIQRVHGIALGEHLMRHGKRARGYPHIRVREDL